MSDRLSFAQIAILVPRLPLSERGSVLVLFNFLDQAHDPSP